MIDTIIIEVDVGEYLRKSDFSRLRKINTLEQDLDNSKPKSLRYISTAYPEDVESAEEYLPEVWYSDYPNPNPMAGCRCYVYKIKASLPKLLYGNNVLEISEAQFDEIVELLYSKILLLNLPTNMSKSDVKSARVVRVDFGKNVMLPGSVSLREVIEMLARSEHKLSSKYAQVQYRNGNLYREHIEERAVIVYDKLAEFCTNTPSPKSEVEKLLVSAKKTNLFQIARVEVQIQTTKQLKIELKSLGLDPDCVTLSNIFSKDLAKSMLLKHWGNITKGLYDGQLEAKGGEWLRMFTEAASKQPHCGPQKAYAKVGFATLLNEVGLDTVKQTYCQYYSSGGWARCRNSLMQEGTAVVDFSAINEITQAIEDFNLLGIWEGGLDVQFQ